MSWLAAARKRVFEMFASSASAFALLKRLVEAGELLGALAHALFQRLVGAAAFLLGRNRFGHVRVGRDEAAVGQPVRADLDHLAGRIELQAHRLEIVQERVEPRARPVPRSCRGRRIRARH